MQLSDFGLDVKFKVNVQNGTICSRHELNEEKIDLFQYSVDHNYWFSMYVDNLPVGGYVGDIDRVSGSPFLYTQFQFDIGYNGNRIIEVNLTMGRPVKLIETGPKISVDFGYSVNWIETDKLFEDRFEKYLDSEFFEHKVHWFSLFNSFMLVLFLTGFVGLILVRTLRHDLARYGTGRGKDLEATTTATNVDYSGHHQSAADYERELGDDYGWKLVHGDVFRQPYNLALLAAMIGSGVQLAVLSLLTIMITIMLDLYEERSSILTSAIFLYALTAIVSGYVSGAFYAQYGGKRWIRTMFLTAGLWPGFVVGCALLINFISIYYSTTKAIPFGTMVTLALT